MLRDDDKKHGGLINPECFRPFKIPKEFSRPNFYDKLKKRNVKEE